MWYVYILFSKKLNGYYIGQSGDVALRLRYHNELSEHSYTSRYRPWELRRAYGFNTRREAILAERYIKGRKSRNFVEWLLEKEDAVSWLQSRIDG
ncbi:MAG: GIY-YIG nuclease family protein [Haliscomenobacter sp.]|nr:GIY-YIG nuclease family protein [Haliscomenobacter sp.]MBK8655003.1 GIY-YIG nuclease family protein [Haliscomenobacter sp.]MBP9075981.1 GIY-YIG nuclease family protein [Haliscomenobacter sp.]